MKLKRTNKRADVSYYVLLQEQWTLEDNLSTNLVEDKNCELEKVLKQTDSLLRNQDELAKALDENQQGERDTLFAQVTQIGDDYKKISATSNAMQLELNDIIGHHALDIPLEEIAEQTEEDLYQKSLGEAQGNTPLSGRFKF